MFDAVHVVVGAVRELNRSQEIGVKPLSCTSPQIWQHGTSLMNYLRMVNTRRALPLPKNIIPSICVQAHSRCLLRFGGNYRIVSHLCVQLICRCLANMTTSDIIAVFVLFSQ